MSRELIRVAIVWAEICNQCLDQASRHYYGGRNIPMMMNALKPLAKIIESTPETSQEISFLQLYGKDLQKAW